MKVTPSALRARSGENPITTHVRLVTRAAAVVASASWISSIDKGLKEQLGWSIAILCVVSLLVSLRLWTRLRIEKKVGVDDGFCLLATLVYVLFLGAALWTRYLGTTTLDTKSVGELLKWNTIAGSSYIWSEILVKLSLGFYILRIIPRTSSSSSEKRQKPSWRRSVCMFIMVFCTAVNILHFVYRLVFCRSTTSYYKTLAGTPSTTRTAASPVATSGSKEVTGNPGSITSIGADLDSTNNLSLSDINAEGFCAVQDSAHLTMVFLAATVNIVADIVFICLPLPEMIRGLRQRRYHKLVFVVIVLAAAGVGIAIARLPFLHGYLASNWRGGGLLTGMALVEPGASIMCGCLATLRPLGEKWFPCLVAKPPSSSSDARDNSQGYQEMSRGVDGRGSSDNQRRHTIEMKDNEQDDDEKEWKEIKV